MYDFIQQVGSIPYATCMPYIACSSDSTDGFCPNVDLSCSAINTCRTCNASGCEAVSRYPNATIAEYGTYSYFTDGFGNVADKIKAEIYARGPVATGVNAEPILEYQGGVVNNTKIWNMLVNHVVSIVGWGTDKATGQQHWIVRNSWGSVSGCWATVLVLCRCKSHRSWHILLQYWGELGYFRIIMGHNALGIESEVAWATPQTFTVENFPCNSDGSNCQLSRAHTYVDPSADTATFRRLRAR